MTGWPCLPKSSRISNPVCRQGSTAAKPDGWRRRGSRDRRTLGPRPRWCFGVRGTTSGCTTNPCVKGGAPAPTARWPRPPHPLLDHHADPGMRAHSRQRRGQGRAGCYFFFGRVGLLCLDPKLLSMVSCLSGGRAWGNGLTPGLAAVPPGGGFFLSVAIGLPPGSSSRHQCGEAKEHGQRERHGSTRPVCRPHYGAPTPRRSAPSPSPAAAAGALTSLS